MKRLHCLIALLSLSGILFAEVPAWIAAVTVNAETRSILDEPVMNNKYIVESIRANNLARQAYADGDYDLSMKFSADALRAARLSDDFIMQRLKIAKANEKIGEAAQRLGWADNSQAKQYYPAEYNNAKAYYNQALLARTAGEWEGALNNAMSAVEALANVAVPAKSGEQDNPALPASYTVRPWDTFGDCFWNIAGRPWVYNNPYHWPILYRANRSKLENPSNPNLIEPGTVLDIPSIRGEIRQGMWDSGKKYSPLK